MGVHLPPARRAEHNMGMPETAERWTAAMVRALPDDRNRYEVIEGELFVTPAPSWPHQWGRWALQTSGQLLARPELGRGRDVARRHLVPRGHARPTRSFRRTHRTRQATAPTMGRHPRAAPRRRSPFAIYSARRPAGKAPALSAR